MKNKQKYLHIFSGEEAKTNAKYMYTFSLDPAYVSVNHPSIEMSSKFSLINQLFSEFWQARI